MNTPFLTRLFGRNIAGVTLAYGTGVLLSALVLTSSAKGEIRYRDVKKIAHEAIQNDDVMTEKPKFTKDLDRKEYNYYLGGVFWVDLRDGQPFDLAMETQLRIELIRKHRVTALLERNDWWGPYLRRAEAVVAEAIEDLNRNNDNELLKRVQDRCDQAMAIIRESPETFARRNGLTAVQQFGEPAALMCTITTRPPGGRVFIIDAMHWRIERARHRDPVRAMEHLAQLNNVPLAGKYYYRITWDNRRPSGPTPFRVRTRGEVELQ